MKSNQKYIIMEPLEDHNTRYYSQEDVQRILQLAITRQSKDQEKEFSYQQLLEIATELEISLDCLHQAEEDWLIAHGERQQRQAFNAYRRSKFNKRLRNFVLINGFFVTLDFLHGGLSWSPYVLLIWGLVMGFDAWNTFQTKGHDYEEAFQKWNRNHKLKQGFNNLINRFFKATSS